METKTQSHCWWFDSFNSSKCSPWLESTLTELNEKTKTMLKLIEEDADSFAQRAEMYYKKRPELISMVEDFYRAHRSLAERYDLLKSDRVVRVKSPLSHSLSLPNEECAYVLESMDSVKSFDSFTEATYSYEEVAESEVDDPEVEEDGAQIEQGGEEVVKSGVECGASYDELMMLREKLDELREENEIQTKIIRRMEEEKEELVTHLYDNIGDLKELRGEIGVVWDDDLGVVEKENNELLASFDEVTKLKDEIENLKVEIVYQKEEFEKKVEEVSYVRKKFEDEQTKNKYLKNEIVKLREEMRRANEKGGDEELQDELTEKGMEKIEAIVQQKDEIFETFQERSEGNRQLMDARICELEEKQEAIMHLKDTLTGKGMEKKEVVVQQKDEIVEKLQERSEGNRELMDARICENEEKKEAITKNDKKKSDAIKQLMEELAEKDMEIRQVSVAMENKMMNALAEKDEEKREAIRQLSAAMEILREESKFLKKSLVSISPKKNTRLDFPKLKAVDFGKLFRFTSSNQTSIVAL